MTFLRIKKCNIIKGCEWGREWKCQYDKVHYLRNYNDSRNKNR